MEFVYKDQCMTNEIILNRVTIDINFYVQLIN